MKTLAKRAMETASHESTHRHSWTNLYSIARYQRASAQRSPSYRWGGICVTAYQTLVKPEKAINNSSPTGNSMKAIV